MGAVTAPGASPLAPILQGPAGDLNAGKAFLPPTAERVIYGGIPPTLFPLYYVYNMSDNLGGGCQWWLPGNREKPLPGASCKGRYQLFE